MKIRADQLNVHAGHARCWMCGDWQHCDALSLANCKSKIRDATIEGDWIP